MTETWAVTILTTAIAIVGAVIGFVVRELRALRTDLKELISRNECDARMGGHCQRLEHLEGEIDDVRKQVDVNTSAISAAHGVVLQ